jgi:hypothetical protein
MRAEHNKITRKVAFLTEDIGVIREYRLQFRSQDNKRTDLEAIKIIVLKPLKIKADVQIFIKGLIIGDGYIPIKQESGPDRGSARG